MKTPEVFKLLMDNYDIWRKRWLEKGGTSDGFDAWFTQEVTPCDGLGPHVTGERRRLPLADGGTAILCHRCYSSVVAWRLRRKDSTPAWQDLEINCATAYLSSSSN